jgi:hypothetical protein
MFIFALLYYVKRDQLYQSTAVAEAQNRNVKKNIEGNFQETFGDIFDQFNSVSKPFRDIHVSITDVTNAKISFIVNYRYSVVRQGTPAQKYILCDLFIPSRQSKDKYLPITITDQSGYFISYFSMFGKKYYAGRKMIRKLTAKIERERKDFEKTGIMEASLLVDKNELEKIYKYQMNQLGYPIHDTGNFIRCLYLSAVTITTLGYGDLVPLTDCVRILVSSEAVIGIVIMGLFLFTLARKYQNTSQQP